jgi:cell division protein FtsB
MKTRDFINILKTTKIMKTGGTLNFLKRAGAILMVVAVFASSCNKYADDFKQLNTKLDALAAQVAGVTQLTTDNAALKAQITALQTAVAALPTAASITALQTGLTGVTTKIDAITTTLGTVATAGAATKTVVDGLKTDLATLATKVSTDNATMIAKLTALGTTDAAQTAQLTSIVADNATILANIATLQTSLNGVALTGSATDAATALTIKGLQLMLQAQKVVLDQLLANSNMYNGDVVITNGPELTFWSKKVAQLGMINGNLTVNTTNLSTKLDSVNFVTKNISAVIGTQGAVKNSVNITSTSTTTLLDLSKLVSVSGDYTLNGVKINDANLSTVGGNFLVNFDGAYSYPNLSTVTGNLTLTKVTPQTTPTVLVGTTSISLPGVTVNGSVFDGVNGAGVLNYPDATSISLAGGVSSLTAAKATTVKLGSTTTTGLTVQTVKATTVDLSALKTATGPLAITADATANVMLDNFATTTALPINVTITGPTTVSLPKYVAGVLTASAATTVTLASHEMASLPVLAAVKTLTLGSVNNPVSLAGYSTLVTANVTGKATTTWAPAAMGGVSFGSGNGALTTVTAGGTLSGLDLTSVAKLNSLTTSGVINNFTLASCPKIASVNLAHTHFVGGPGSSVVVTGNAILTSLKTSTDYPATITVTNNVLLTSLDLSSYVTKLLSAPGATTNITISGNKLSGAYTNAVAITPTTPYVETTITSADLAKLKAFVAAHTTATPVLNLALNLDLVTNGTNPVATLSANMSADTQHTPAFVAPANGIAAIAEMALVK